MTLRIHDTYQRSKVDFVPHDAAHVQFYVCGPTVYDYAHIGNARPIVAFDVLMRDGEALRDVPYGERFAMAQADARTISMTFPLQLASKRLWPASHVRNAAAVAGDGVVLHRLDHARETFKWKPVHTVDVFCDGKTLALAGGLERTMLLHQA